jgi:hypothetical protein
MVLRTLVRQLPLRLTTGSYILNAGLAKLDADDQTAKQLHDLAAGAFPVLRDLDPRIFTGVVAGSEVALGAALLAPVVPGWVVGIGLGAFAGGMLRMYTKTPGLRHEQSLRPTEEGVALAKDVWMLGMAASLILERIRPRRRHGADA